MASVQELILAAEAEKSPFIAMLEGAAQGFQSRQMHPLDMATKQMQLERQQQALEFDKMLRAAYEQTLKQQLSNVAPESHGPLPTQKVETLFSGGPRGMSFRQVTKPFQSDAPRGNWYKDDAGQWKRWTAQKEAKAATAVGGVSPAQMQRQNLEAYKQAVKWFVQDNPEKGVTDPLSGKIVDTRISHEDTQSGEFQGLFERAKKMISEGTIDNPMPTIKSPQGQSPEAYLRSVNAKVTPANIEWAKRKLAGER